ncbi:MAG: FG-GAP repeat domain-containing protein, partial [Desulfovibrionaceae bacterium]
LFQRPGADKDAERAKQEQEQEQETKGDTPANPAFVYGETGEPTGVDAVNPRFKYQSSPDTPGRWRSQSLPFAAECSLAGDMNNDGVTEIIIVGQAMIRAYHIEQGRLMEVGKADISSRIQPLRISSIDLDNDGLQEIVVSGIENEKPRSLIFNYDGGGFSLKHDRVNYYLNVVSLPPLYKKTLIGQEVGLAQAFRAGGIREVDVVGGGFTLTRKIRLPEYTNLFNFCYMPGEDDTHRLLVISPHGKLRLYSEDLNILYQTEETFNGSSLAIQVVKRLPGMAAPREDTRLYDTYYVPMPITVALLGDSSRPQVLVSRDISVAAEFFDRFRYFSQGEIHSLHYDGIGLNLLWKTRRIKGTIVDYGLADIDNDGGLDLWISLNTYPGAMGLKYRKTLMLSYPLELPADQASTQ